MKVKLISQTTGAGEFQGRTAEELIVFCARVSSNREDKFESPEGLLSYCIRNNHWSILETASMTFEITTSMPIAEQLIRHRSFTFQKLSGRYTEMNEFEPIVLRRQAEKNRQSSTEEFNPILPEYDYSHLNGEYYDRQAEGAITEHIQNTKWIYDRLIRAGVARECARMVLPLCTQTTMYMTGSIRSWVHLFEVRDFDHAQLEVRQIVQQIKAIFKENLPIISKALNY